MKPGPGGTISALAEKSTHVPVRFGLSLITHTGRTIELSLGSKKHVIVFPELESVAISSLFSSGVRPSESVILTSTTTILMALEDVPQVARTVVPSDVDDTTSIGNVACPGVVAVAFVQVGLPLGHEPEGFGAAVTGIVAPGLPLATYTVCEAPGLFVVDVTPPAETEATPTTRIPLDAVAEPPPPQLAVTEIVFVPVLLHVWP